MQESHRSRKDSLEEKEMLSKRFDLSGRVGVVTGGAGLLGVQHAEAMAEAGGTPILWDINEAAAKDAAIKIQESFGVECMGRKVDITDHNNIEVALEDIVRKYGRVDILINNAAHDPKVGPNNSDWSRFEKYTPEMWQHDIAVGLTGAFFCSQTIGQFMAEHNGGVILNVASDLGVIAPDQRIYRKEGLQEKHQPVKPVSYSVVKHGLIGLTKYLATYWADKKIRVNAISPGGIYTNQPADFVIKLTNLIPLGRMANKDEYRAAVLFLVSDASSYMTGANLIIDGGRSCW